MNWLRVRFGTSIFVFLCLAVACHTTPVRTPSVPPSPVSEADWLKDYKTARTEPLRACEIFKRLAADEHFPIRDMARLRAVEACPAGEISGFNRAQLPPWLQDQAVDVLLKQAAQTQDKKAELDLAVEKSKLKLPQSEKIKWMNLALQRADELQLADRTQELKQRLYTIAPRLNPEPKERQYLSFASDLRLVRQFDRAREYYEKVLQSNAFDNDEKVSALKGIRLTYKNARQNELHLQTAQRLIDFFKKAAGTNPRSRPLLTAQYDAEVYKGRALWTLGRTTEAKKVFDGLQKRMKGKVSLAELYWLKGRMCEEVKDFACVTKYMDLALKENLREGDLHDKIIWYTAWNERLQNHLPRAIELLSRLEDKTQTDFTRQRALFWLAKTQSDNHQIEDAKKSFARLIELDPLGYYGLMAHKELGAPITLQGPVDGNTPVPEVKIPLDTTIAEWLYLVQEQDALTGQLDLASVAYRKQKDQNDDGWVQIFKYYAKAGLYMKLYASLGDLSPDRRKSIFEHHPELLFPQPWNEEIRAASVQFGIDEELIYSIIRQESAFDPHARSLADAFGLMQLLPEVAEQLSDKYKIPYSGMDDLYDPKTNVSFGAAHLKELFARHNNQFILAVASYNASENVIRTWLKTRFRGDALEFIEDIPYEETRAYVRLVMRNLIFYSLLKAKSPSIEFPAHVLTLSE